MLIKFCNQLLSFTRDVFPIISALISLLAVFALGLSTILFAVVMVGVAGLIIFEAVKSISEEFNLEIPSIGLPKLALAKSSSPKVDVSTQKGAFRHNF